MPEGIPSARLFRAVLVTLAVMVGIALFLLWWEVPSGSAVPAAPRPPVAEAPTSEAGSPTSTPAPSPTAVGPQRYTVKEGDTLLAIAIQLGTTVKAIAEANGLEEPYNLRIGQELVIPKAAEAAPTPTTPAPSPTAAGPQRYTVKEDDTLLAIAIQLGTTVKAIAEANGLEEPYNLRIGQELVIPMAAEAVPTPTTPAPSPTAVGPQRYTVKESDTLLAIAIRFGTTVKAIAEANGLEEPYNLRIGQELVIPPS